MSRVEGPRIRHKLLTADQRAAASRDQTRQDGQQPDDDEEADEAPKRVVRMPYVAFLDPARSKVKG